MSKNNNAVYSDEKAFQQFGSRLKRKPFTLIEQTQKLAYTIQNATLKSEKGYRQGIVAEVWKESYELIHYVRQGNFHNLGAIDRFTCQDKAEECIERIYDLIPVLRMCRCISPGQEGVIEKELCNVKGIFRGWVKSDKERLFKGIREMIRILLTNTVNASEFYHNNNSNKSFSWQISILQRLNDNDDLNNEELMFAGALQKIREQKFKVDEFFLYSITEDNRFIFSDKKRERFFAIQCRRRLNAKIQYRDDRGYYYDTDSIYNAVNKFSKKK